MPVFAPNFVIVAPVAAPVMLASSVGLEARSQPAQRPADDCRKRMGTTAVGLSPQQALMQRLQNDATTLGHSRSALIAKHALKLSQDREGCRLVQQALEEAESDEARSALVETLHGHVWEVAICPHANHVLQKYIVTMKPGACQFIIDEIMQQGAGSACKLARHKYGYRVFQRLLEHLLPQQKAQLISGLVTDCVSISMHRYGTFVMQHVLEYGSDAQRELVIAALVPHISKLSMNNDACMVLDAALVKSDAESQELLIRAMLQTDGSIGAMAHTRRGHVVVLSLFELVGGELLESAKRQIGKQSSSLNRNRFGRLVLNFVQVHCGSIVPAAIGGA